MIFGKDKGQPAPGRTRDRPGIRPVFHNNAAEVFGLGLSAAAVGPSAELDTAMAMRASRFAERSYGLGGGVLIPSLLS